MKHILQPALSRVRYSSIVDQVVHAGDIREC